MKKICIAIFSLLVSIALPAQTTPPTSYLGNYTQPAPNAAALGKYVDYPVGFYTGTPNINIPLFNLQDGAVKVPISLSYHASGIRVSEMASWVGLGWALNCGGMITRTVRGGPDEGVWSAQSNPIGYYSDSGLSKMPLLPYPINGVIPSDNIAETRRNFLIQVGGVRVDCEPDLYTFNFNGYTGKFVFDEQRIPRLLTEGDMKVSVVYSGTNYGNFVSWTIVTPDGVKYFFGENGMQEVNSISSNTGLQDNNSLRPSSWCLTRIVYPNTRDTVYFNYTSETYAYFDLGQEGKVYGGGNTDPMQQACSFDGSDLPSTVYKTTMTGLRLTSVRSKNYTIVFAAHTARQDVVNTAYALDSVSILNTQNQCLKQYLLSYTYFSSTTAANLPSGAGAIMSGDVSDTKRLKLLSVKEYSGDGLSAKPPYVFTYNETLQLPRRMSFDQDHWGFSNNSSGNSNIRFTPRVSHPVCINALGVAANRDPKWPDMQSFSLKSIRDPLGVLTNFEFEAHTSSSTFPAKTIGGLRVHKITTTDSLTGKSQVRSYDYADGGVLYKSPQYLVFPENEYYFPTGNLTQNRVGYRGYSYGYGSLLICAIRQSQSIVPMQDFQGNHIGYPLVKEIFGPNGEGGSKVYIYSAYALYPNFSRLDMVNYTASYTFADPWAGNYSATVGNGHFNDILPQNLLYYNASSAGYLYPFSPDQVDFRRGQLLGEDTYDSAKSLLRSMRNYYKETYHENYWIRGFKLFRTGAGSGTNFFNDAMTYYKLHTGISHLASSSTTDFKNSKSMTITHNYGYEDTLHTLQTADTTVNSLGDSLITKKYYSFDYANAADNVFAKMKARNMLLPVATRLWKNNQLINGAVTQFKDYAANSTDTFINPVKVYGLETSSPLTAVQANENIAFGSPFTVLVPNSSFIEKADFNYSGTTGKITDQKLAKNKNQALIWDSVTAMVLAHVDNADFGDIAYGSFETADKGNWTYTSSAVITDATAPTGTHGYTPGASYPISRSGLTASKSYVFSYWIKSGGSITITGGTSSNAITGQTLNGWTYHELTITGTTSISILGTANLDELRLYPSSAQMTTYTYDPLLRLIAQCSINNIITYYEYDGFNRLVDIKDQSGNVIKAFEYNYGRQSRISQ